MISILIPVYNYSITKLVERLHGELQSLNIPAEILVLDDASEDIFTVKQNKGINDLEGCRYMVSEENLGRTKARHTLATQAKYDWLLFLDADVLPKEIDFIKRFFDNLENADVVFGGITYQEELPQNKEVLLRWKYGHLRESQPVSSRVQNPYISVISGAVFIKKSVFKEVNRFLENRYGADVLFTSGLKKLGAKVVHIDNPVYHLGLESNGVFLKKSLAAMQTLAYFTKEGLVPENYSRMQRRTRQFKNKILATLTAAALRPVRPFLVKRVLSPEPDLRSFDALRLLAYLEALNDET